MELIMRELQREIINELGVRPTIDPEQEIRERTQFLADRLGATSLNGFVLGISGGQDSLLAGILAQRAAEQLRDAGRDATFTALLLPYGIQRDRDDALLAIETIAPDRVYDINIQPATDAFVASIEAATGEKVRDFDKGNAKARARMMAQYVFTSIVLGTDHAAEAVTGFYTKYGDGAADILPLSGLNKRQGRQMLQTLGVPEVFTTKQPTADLLDNNPGQADETELGLAYDAIDASLGGKEADPAIAAAIEQRYLTTQHKREMPVAFTR